MLANSRPSKHQLSFKLLFDRLFAVPASTIDSAPPHQIRQWLDAVKLELVRERNKGKARHYRYDLNRHIALAAARDVLAQRLN